MIADTPHKMQVLNLVSDFRYDVQVPRTLPQMSVSEFTTSFSRHLRDFMAEREVTQEAVAAKLGRSQAFVSEHTMGLRDPGTDLINAVAVLAGTDPRSLMLDLTSRMVAEPART